MKQSNPINSNTERSLLDQLLSDSRLYRQSKDYKALLDFVVKLRNFAPFNAMLLQVQKPGLSYAASAHDWQLRFGRSIKEGARPLLILWPFGPVALVYDVQDTEGKPLPRDVASFFAQGAIDELRVAGFRPLLSRKGIDWLYVDAGDQRGGMIRVVQRPATPTEKTLYRIHINQNHPAPTQFATLAHELAHLFLGHLGPDKPLNVPQRPFTTNAQRELEAESVAFLVCKRNGLTPKSETYLATFVQQNTTIEQLDLYQIMRAAGQVESILGLTAHTKYERPKKAENQHQILFGKMATVAQENTPNLNEG